MIRDHTAAAAQLTATATGIGAEVPETLAAEHDGMRGKLQTLHGKVFDEQYTRAMVEDHNEAAKLFRTEGASAKTLS
jgi:putative membrane protein